MIIGVFGGSGCGKSTISRILADRLPNSLLINGDIFMHAISKQLEKEILKKINVVKEEKVFSYNYYLDSFYNVKMWVKTIEDKVITDIQKEIHMKGKNKDYIIIDWVFLPMCEWSKECDKLICVTANYGLKYDRLSNRLKDKSLYNEGDRSFWSYKDGVIEKRLEYTSLNEWGYKYDYEICNDGELDELYKNIQLLIKKIVKGQKIEEKRSIMEYLDIYNEKKELTGKTIERHESRDNLLENEYFLFEQAWIINSSGKILLTRRSPTKKYAGFWEPTSGHVKTGESSLDGIKRELKEEIGVEVSDNELTQITSFIDKKSIKEVWIVKKDILVENLKFADDEVSDAKYVTIEEFKEMLKNNETFNNLRYFIELYEKKLGGNL